MLPEIGYYLIKPSGRIDGNAPMVTIGQLTLWFSYLTPIAFQVGGHPRVISQNYWGSQTGKHLNSIDPDKSKRVKANEFKDRLGAVLAEVNQALEERMPY